MSQEERIKNFMQIQQMALEKTGITYAVEAGQNLMVFDTHKNEPVALEIMIGTEVINENGRTSITTFDNSEADNDQE